MSQSGRGSTIWCYTTDKNKRWDYCDVSMDTSQISQGISDAQKQGNEQLQKFLDSRPNLNNGDLENLIL